MNAIFEVQKRLGTNGLSAAEFARFQVPDPLYDPAQEEPAHSETSGGVTLSLLAAFATEIQGVIETHAEAMGAFSDEIGALRSMLDAERRENSEMRNTVSHLKSQISDLQRQKTAKFIAPEAGCYKTAKSRREFVDALMQIVKEKPSLLDMSNGKKGVILNVCYEARNRGLRTVRSCSPRPSNFGIYAKEFWARVNNLAT
jgi:archaellum component FlaC